MKIFFESIPTGRSRSVRVIRCIRTKGNVSEEGLSPVTFGTITKLCETKLWILESRVHAYTKGFERPNFERHDDF